MSGFSNQSSPAINIREHPYRRVDGWTGVQLLPTPTLVAVRAASHGAALPARASPDSAQPLARQIPP